MLNPRTHPTYNDTCPFCKEIALHGTILETFGDVPLGAEGWNTVDSNTFESEVDYVSCHACGKDDLIQHYLSHDVFVDREYQHCDCVPEEPDEDAPEESHDPG